MDTLPLPPVRRGTDAETLLRTLSNRRGTFLGFFGAVLAAAIGGSLLVEPRYQATAVIQLLPRAGQEMNVTEVVATEGGYYEARDRARTQMQIILSRGVREEVVRRYNALGKDQLDASFEGLDALLASMTVTPLEDTQLVEIAVIDTDPERAARIANFVAEVYLEVNLAARTDAAREARRWLEGRGESARDALRAANTQVLAFEIANVRVDLDTQEDDITARRGALQAALAEATTERVVLGSRVEEHRQLLGRGDAGLLTGEFDDPGLSALAGEHANLLTRNAETLSRYGDKHPEYQQAIAQTRRVEAMITEAVRRNVDAEEARLESLARQETDLRSELARTKSEHIEKQKLSAQYTQLQLDQERARRQFGAITDREAEVEMQAESRLNDVRIVDHALPPSGPVSPDLPLNLAVALGVGLVGGVGAALGRDRLEDTLRSATGARS